MNIPEPVIVLGAGASHGARVDGKKTPPLDADFLSEAQQLFANRHGGKDRQHIAAWRVFENHLKDAKLKFKEVKNWRLEQLSTFLEARSNLRGLQLGTGRPREYTRALDSLKVVIGHVLLKCGGDKACQFHRMLFQAVQARSIVSFNYDLIADQTLLQMGKLNWRSANYRGAKVARIPSKKGKSYSRPLETAKPRGTVPLLKLHGSIHWEKLDRGDGYRLSGCRLPESNGETFDVVSVPEHPYLIPPVASKIEIKDGVLRKHWYSAVHELHDAKSWIIWGYSFPQIDTIAQVLFRTALDRNKKPKPVFVVNPDASVVERVKDVCRKVKVKHYTSIESLLYELGILEEKQRDNWVPVIGQEDV